MAKTGKSWHRLYFVSAVIGRNGLAAPEKKKKAMAKHHQEYIRLGLPLVMLPQ